MKISLTKITIITLALLLLFCASILYIKITSNEAIILTHRIETNQNKVEGHLKFITSLYNARKILKRFLNENGNYKEVKNYLNSMEKNSPNIKNYISIDNGGFEPELPDFLKQSEIKNDTSSNKRSIIFDGKDYFVINKIQENNSRIISTYSVNYDEKLKKRISDTEFTGYLIITEEDSYFWHRGSENQTITHNIKNYRMTLKEQIIRVENSTGIPGFYFTISDGLNSKNALKDFLIALIFLIFIFSIIGILFYFMLKANKSVIYSIDNLALNGEDVKEKQFNFEEHDNIMSKVENIYKSNMQLNEAIVSKNKRLKKLEGLSKNKMNFLAQISHEIRTPMNCIIGFSEMILSENETKNNKIFASKIIEESETLLKLINDILDDSKIDSGKMILECNRVNLEEFFSRMIDLGNSYDTNNLIDIEYFIDSALPIYIGIDELRFYQVVTNVYFNALKYTPIGSIKINIIKGFGNKISISIIDTGIGIPNDKLPTIFDDYERVNGKLNTGFRGTGLGLSITKKIIELMNGSISVESEQGTGSSFTITIPFKDVEQKLETKKEVKKSSFSFNLNGDVLLAEDYPTNRIIAKRHLESAGLKVTMAENGKEAIELANEKKFDIILMDIQMPIMDGFTATKEIRDSSNYNQDTPIVAMTANGLKSVEERSKQFLMNGVILKPIKKVNFLETVSSYIKNPVLVN